MKKTLVVLLLFLFPLAMEAMVSFDESLDLAPAMDNQVGIINSIARDPDNYMNIILSVQVEVTEYEPEPVMVFVSGSVLVRDKEGIIEEAVKPGMSVGFPSYSLRQDFVKDYTSGGTGLTFYTAEEDLAAELRRYSAEREGYQIGIDIAGVPTIATIETTADCMPGRDDVCHPIVHVESLIDGKVVTASFESGDEFPATPAYLDHIHLTDAHTYAEYASTDFTAFANIELLLVFSQSETLTAEQALADAPVELSEIGTTYCQYSFSESGLAVEKTCSLYDRIRNFMTTVTQWFDDPFGGFYDPYEYEIC